MTEAQKIEHDYEVGEEVTERVDFAKFGRRAIQKTVPCLSKKQWTEAKERNIIARNAFLCTAYAYDTKSKINAKDCNVSGERASTY